MDIDFIKWMCDKAEGFDFFEDDIDVIDDYILYFNGYGISYLDSDLKTTAMYLLLNQRAIEGINKEDGIYRVEQMYNMVEVLNSDEYDVAINYEFTEYVFPDQAKESALMYIYEQEKEA